MCGDQDCQEIITSRKLHLMSTPDFDEIEESAKFEAGRAGLAYLKAAGTTDLRALEPHQALEFIERVIDGFGAHLRARLIAQTHIDSENESSR